MPSPRPSTARIFFVALKLGCTSFGGPIAHLGYFRNEYVERQRWISDADYAELVALCQFLPGPASSQVGFGLGLLKRGLAGGIAAWLGFTLPSAVLMTLFAYGIGTLHHADSSGWLAGLKLAAAAVVAQAVVAMWRQLCPDLLRSLIAAAAAAAVSYGSGAGGQLGVLACGALAGAWLVRIERPAAARPPVKRSARGLPWLVLFFGLLIALPLAAHIVPAGWIAIADRLYRTGALIFGGGHTVVPILGQQVVAAGWVTPDRFIAGYGFAQAMPGPLFTFAAYLGALFPIGPRGVAGAAWALGWIFLPGLLLVGGVLPWWSAIRKSAGVRSALAGINAAIVGILLAAWIDPIATTSLLGGRELFIAAAAFIALQPGRVPAWLVVLASACAGALLL
jgi:chromate transporter